MKRYFKWKEELFRRLEINYIEFEDEYATRVVKVRNGIWSWARWEDNRFAFPDQPLSSTDFGLKDEISQNELEDAWEEAQKKGDIDLSR